MVNMKFFEDGGRLVIVLDGVDIPSTETLLTQMFTQLISESAVEKCEPGEAAPVVTQEEKIEIPTTFTEGPYIGLSPEQVLTEGSDEEMNTAFQWILEQLKDKTNILYDNMESAAWKYMGRKFGQCNPEEYAAKLTAKQVSIFYSRFKNAVPLTVRETLMQRYNLSSWDNVSQEEDNLARTVMKDILTKCISQKE